MKKEKEYTIMPSCMCVCVCVLSHSGMFDSFVTPRTVAREAPLVHGILQGKNTGVG